MHQAHVVAFMKQAPTFTAFKVTRELARHLGVSFNDPVAYRGADRLIQRERKAGNIGPSDPSRGRSAYWKWRGAK
ncbi:hypothetical protein E1956_25980 [Paraburkholderia pallida]|uniref:Uncharacterized protein n=2 Tax=Paraburkholderia pallida TaxID=2547399 RepID=A0A4P7CWC2_9BURK|nr:hypothetical protein E1956_25980 [Paraburkholderia pallida]